MSDRDRARGGALLVRGLRPLEEELMRRQGPPEQLSVQVENATVASSIAEILRAAGSGRGGRQYARLWLVLDLADCNNRVEFAIPGVHAINGDSRLALGALPGVLRLDVRKKAREPALA